MRRNLFRTIEHVENAMSRGLEQRPAVPPRGRPKPSPRAWHAPASDDVYPEQTFVFQKEKRVATQLAVTSRALKVSATLDAAEVGALPDNGQDRTHLAVTCNGIVYRAEIATKSLRKAKMTIAASGAASVFVMVQGKLKGNEIIECGLVAQVKAPKQEVKP
jgi:hypothetical protein